MRHFLFLFLLAISNSIVAQNIYTALHLNRPEDVRSNKAIAEISAESTFVNYQEVRKETKFLNRNYLVSKEERFDQQGKLTDRLTRKFDSTETKTIARQFERWNKLGYSSETSFYEYDDKGFLIKMTDKTAKGNIIQQAFLTNNDKGHPIKLELYDGQSNLYGTELATYNYSTNKVQTEVLNGNGKSISKDSIVIDFTKMKDFPRPGDVFNDFGDLVSSDTNVYERKYDEFNNWTKTVIYKLTEGKKKKERVFTRKIKYL